MRLYQEKEEARYTSEEEAMKAIKLRDASLVRGECRAKDIKPSAYEALPILTGLGLHPAEVDETVSVETIRAVTEDTGVEVVAGIPFDEKSEWKVFPMRETAYGDFVSQVCGFGQAPVLLNLGANRSRYAMAPAERVECLKSGIETNKAKVKFEIRDEAINCFHGDGYTWLNFSEMTEKLKERIEKDCDCSFRYMTVSHEYDTVMYDVENPIEAGRIAGILGLPGDKVKLSVKLGSSDRGISSATIYPFIVMNGNEVLFGKPLPTPHRGSVTPDTVAEKFSEVFAMTKEMANKISEMRDLVAAAPKGLFLRLAKEVGLPKKMSLEAADALTESFESPTYFNVWWMLQKTLERYEKEYNLTQMRKVALSETLCRQVIGNHYEGSDFTFEWE